VHKHRLAGPVCRKIQQQWRKLTDDESTRADGNIDELTARMQKSHGDSREKMAQEINQLINKLDGD